MADHLLQIPQGVKKALGGKGKKLRTQEMTLRRLEKNRVLATHHLTDRNGVPPTDGQRSTMEYAVDQDQIGDHVHNHMGPDSDSDEDDQ